MFIVSSDLFNITPSFIISNKMICQRNKMREIEKVLLKMQIASRNELLTLKKTFWDIQ